MTSYWTFTAGYYGGTGGRLMTTLGPFQGVTQSDPPIGPKRVRDCQWEPCAEYARKVRYRLVPGVW